MKFHIQFLFFLLIFSGMSSCSSATQNEKEQRDTPETGEVNIVVDETMKPIFEAEKDAFENLFPKAKLNLSYLPESKCLDKFLSKEAKVIALARNLRSEERRVFESEKLEARETYVGIDGLAFIVGTGNPIRQLSSSQIKAILNGETTTWASITQGKFNDSIRIVVDNSGSSLLRFLEDRYGKFSEKIEVFATGTNPLVIDYVKSNPAGLGIIGMNWISDIDDSLAQTFRNGLTILSLEAPDSAKNPGDYFQPYVGDISDNNYPFYRPVILASWEPYIGLGTGFVHFVSKEIGQRILAKGGLYPSVQPAHTIQLPPLENAKEIKKQIEEERKKK